MASIMCGSLQLDVDSDKAKITISGDLNERLRSDELIHHLGEHLPPTGLLTLDLAKIERLNSIGLAQFSKALYRYPDQLSLSQLPVLLVQSANSQISLIPRKMPIESLFVPFYDAARDEQVLVCCQVGKEIPLLEDYSDFDLSALLPKNSPLVADVEAEEYFCILTFRALGLAV